MSDYGAQLDEHKCGKWMYYFGDVGFAAKVCQEAVENDIVAEAKHSDSPEGVCCFYLNGDDLHFATVNGRFCGAKRTRCVA